MSKSMVPSVSAGAREAVSRAVRHGEEQAGLDQPIDTSLDEPAVFAYLPDAQAPGPRARR